MAEEALDPRLVSLVCPDRPKCCAIAHIAMNSRVEPEVICGPLSLTANRIGRRTATLRIGDAVLAFGDEFIQALKLQGVAERGLDLGAGLFAGDDFADPFAGDEVHDRDHATLG